ncbi:sigma-54-dependent Fis family transcriptional regulator [Agrobacterium sp. a22-2]|uniref:sigma-54-dependent transcriptional regulator n=1 Tax=Agrobacterium sp. a22-2 TaxID=2283840 RepID=UPI001445DB23|nr:sigma-54 dependent transcriptional regulator [Agrobacterium sp. a22-2]NKN35514.1 sigma-54-dependent Fis family transcriptional regulator [Agrobacterium sp. a22-2]
MTAHILVVDDDPVQRRLLKAAVESQGHVVHLAEDGQTGLAYFRRNHADISVILLDLMMPGMNGLEFLGALGGLEAEVPVIVQTGQGGIETVVQAMRAGAFDFVVKPVSPERIAAAIGNALKVDQRDSKARPVRRPRSGAVGFSDIISASPAMARVMDLARRAAQSNIPVVLEGESGVGKEMVARAIQSASDRSSRPFITVNCGAIPRNLVESILFGHEKGAFTGATERHVGKFAEADGGTLFLDEIGDLPLDTQVKLLRAVQEGEIETIGARQPQKVNVRLISATNKDLIEEVKAGRFREDLYYRLNVFPITIPALRRRKEDIPFLARAFTERFSAEQRLARPLALGAGALALLTAFDWPGNIRQLENAIYRAVILSEGPELTENDFPQILAQIPGGLASQDVWPGFAGLELVPSSPPPAPQLVRMPERADTTALAERISAVRVDEDGSGSKDNVIVSTDDSGNVRRLADIEEELIRFALKFYRGQMSQVARKLGIGRSTLYRKLKDYGIDPENPHKHAA